MSVTTDVTKTGDTVTGRFTLRGLPTVDDVKKPAFAAFGLVDLAIEQVKDVPAELQGEVAKAQARLAELPTVVKTLPAQVKTLPAQAQSLAGEFEARATKFYGELAVRGERLVTAIRRQPATEAAIAEGKEAVRKAEAAATAAKKSTRAAAKAADQAAEKLG